jgi:hypothetical protein
MRRGHAFAETQLTHEFLSLMLGMRSEQTFTSRWNKRAKAANVLPPSGREMVARGGVSFFPGAAFAKAA